MAREKDILWFQISSMAFRMLPAIRLSMGNSILKIPQRKCPQAEQCWSSEEAVKNPREVPCLWFWWALQIGTSQAGDGNHGASPRRALVAVLKPLGGWRLLPSPVTQNSRGSRETSLMQAIWPKIKWKIYQRNESHRSVTLWGFFPSLFSAAGFVSTLCIYFIFLLCRPFNHLLVAVLYDRF